MQLPVQAYFVLRYLAHSSIEVSMTRGFSDEGLVRFLISRDLAVEIKGVLSIIMAGLAVSEIAAKRI